MNKEKIKTKQNEMHKCKNAVRGLNRAKEFYTK